MNGNEGTADRSGLFRVRHTCTGLYVARSLRQARMPDDLVDGLNLFLDRRVNAAAFERSVAEKVGDVWIALTGDHGIELEPLEG